MITALRSEILVPWHKQQVEQPRPILDLIQSDFGGLVYQPTVGLHANVGAIDFVSLYPSVMVRCNISPEKQSISLADPPPEDPGLVPRMCFNPLTRMGQPFPCGWMAMLRQRRFYRGAESIEPVIPEFTIQR